MFVLTTQYLLCIWLLALVADLHPESCCCINVFLFELRTTNWIVLVALTLKTNKRQAEAVSDLLNRL